MTVDEFDFLNGEEEIEDVVLPEDRPYVPPVRQPLAQDEATVTEIEEALDTAWDKVLEAMSLINYAVALVEHSSEKKRLEQVVAVIKRLRKEMFLLHTVWDKSQVGRRLRYGNEGRPVQDAFDELDLLVAKEEDDATEPSDEAQAVESAEPERSEPAR